MRILNLIIGKRNASDRALSEAIRNIFGYTPKNVAIYTLAFRHKSMATLVSHGFKHSNERLEYLGDAVLGSVVADFLFKKFPFKDEGFLTEMRSRIVSRSTLNLISRKMGLDQLVETSKENGINGTSILGDAFEAFIGAVYLDKGYRFTQELIVRKIIATHLDIDELTEKESNFKSKIIEWAQKEKRKVEFVLKGQTGNPKQGNTYRVELKIDHVTAGSGQDFSIKKAEQNAARQVWEQMMQSEKETGEGEQ